MRAEEHPPPEVNIYTDNGEKVSTQKFSRIKHYTMLYTAVHGCT